MENVDSQTEKIELSFFKHGHWKNVVADRSTTANRNSIIRLADKGIEVNSENAGLLVKYIANAVASSLNTLPHKPAKSVMGWVEDQFMPYTDQIVFDGDDQFKHLYRSITSKGNLKDWIDFIRPLRDNVELRLCMASSFASPLIELVGENPFVFHLWGGTGSGKTVALMVAMSIWGDPAIGAMTRTMNMTANSMLSTASFLRNIPFAGDELQTIKSRWTNYDNLIMCITEGIDRGRMTYDKVNETRSWKCSFIFSGEEPCIKQASGGGAKNRVIEIECKNKLVRNGNETANFVRRNFGHAGRRFVEYIKEKNVVELYSTIFSEILSNVDTTDKQAGAMALMLAADRIASELFWPGENALCAHDIEKFLCSSAEIDVSERAYQWLLDTVSENINNFQTGAKPCWGAVEGCFVYINRSVLDRILKDAGFDLCSALTTWTYNGNAERYTDGKFRWPKRISGVITSCIKIRMRNNVENIHPDSIPFN